MRERRPYAGGREFGDAGAYERIDGMIAFAVAPEDMANNSIVDLDRAPRDAAGLVTFRADFCLLQPRNPQCGNRRLLCEVPNRGRKLVPRSINHAPPEPTPSAAIDPGDGFLLRQGWTIAWCGWQWDIIASPALLGLDAPEALDTDGRSLVGQTIYRFRPNLPSKVQPLADLAHTAYPAADLADDTASLTVSDWSHGPRTTIPRDRWRFARETPEGPVADPTSIWLGEGFEPGRSYELTYQTNRSPVVGTGLLAIRDTAAFLRHGAASQGNPAAGQIDRTFAFGISQSGRVLRQFLHLGLNLDEAGRQVFDGIHCHVAGAWRGQFNNRYGQPGVMDTPGFGHLPPFATDANGAAQGLLARQRARGGVPKIFFTNTAAEYWRGDCALLHIDPLHGHDLDLPADTRAYLFAGTQHGIGVLPLHQHNPLDGTRGAHPFNVLDYTPLLRAALANLDAWVTVGTEPPPSAVPRLGDGTAILNTAALDAYRAIPDATVPEPAWLPALRPVDLGPGAARGIGRYPAIEGDPYPVYVSAVDEDGNEIAGLRLPDVSVPVGTHTGWNPRGEGVGGAGQLLALQGSTLPFASTTAARETNSDPRLSISERYHDRADYLARVRGAAEKLVTQRALLAEDVEMALRSAAERYDALYEGEIET
jgi:hypothetical protein